MKLSLSFAQRLLLLLLLFFLGLMLTAGFQYLIASRTNDTVAALRIGIVAQDMIAFIIPALVTAMLITRLPADFLQIRTFPSGKKLLIAAVCLVAALPLIDGINALCEKLPWPQWVVEFETTAANSVTTIFGEHTLPNLIISVLIVGILAGVSEELLFRGALQRILATKPMSIHIAIWLTAIIFSLIHFQMIGFVPRMLLGAFFGYAVVWTGSLWTAVILHALNNSISVIAEWYGFEPTTSIVASLISAVVVAILLWLLRQTK